MFHFKRISSSIETTILNVQNISSVNYSRFLLRPLLNSDRALFYNVEKYSPISIFNRYFSISSFSKPRPRYSNSNEQIRSTGPREFIPAAPSELKLNPFENLDSSKLDTIRGDMLKYNEAKITIEGESCPPPIDSFEEIELDPMLMKNIQSSGFKKPVAAQRYSLPIVLSGRDLMTCAQTGSGKTVAFLFPIITSLAKRESPHSSKFGDFRTGHVKPVDSAKRMSSSVMMTASPTALILTPTRELAAQIHGEALKFGWRTGLKSVCIFGGASSLSQAQLLRYGCDLLIATPGRLRDFLQQGIVSLERIRFLVLDEADRMLDMGFEPEIREIVERHRMPPKGSGSRQTLMFSATFPKEIQKLAASFLDRPLFLSVGRIGAPADLVRQQFILVASIDRKADELLKILMHQVDNATRRKENEPKDNENASGEIAANGNLSAARSELVSASGGRTLIFVERKSSVDFLTFKLQEADFNVVGLHGDHSQSARNRSMHLFTQGKASIMVATNVAARGLDIQDISHVINFDMPKEIDSYIHRIGRTGRAGKPGLATTLLTREDAGIVDSLTSMLMEAKQEVPSWFYDMRASSKSFSTFSRNNNNNMKHRFRPNGIDWSSSRTTSGNHYTIGNSRNGSDNDNRYSRINNSHFGDYYKNRSGNSSSRRSSSSSSGNNNDDNDEHSNLKNRSSRNNGDDDIGNHTFLGRRSSLKDFF